MARWRPEAVVEAWMYRIALNVAFSYCRRAGLRQMTERLLRPGLGRADARIAAPLRQALARLPPREAAAVMLRHYRRCGLLRIVSTPGAGC